MPRPWTYGNPRRGNRASISMLEEGVDYSHGFVELSKQKSENKTRFSDEQIRSLEVTFQSHTKLEPTKKAQLAKELGLQPRQVAIWFQNKRARWKSKQIEKDYTTLLANYNDLASQFESLKKEKQSLLAQLQELKNQVAGNSEEKNHCQIQQTAAANDSGTKMCIEVKNIETNSKSLEEWLSSEEEEEEEEDRSEKARLLGLDEENESSRILLDQPAVDSSLTSSEDWGSLDDSEDLINQPTGSYLWWDFWS